MTILHTADFSAWEASTSAVLGCHSSILCGPGSHSRPATAGQAYGYLYGERPRNTRARMR